MNAVSCSRQLPHILQPKSGPLTTLSVSASKRLAAGCLLKGRNAGCQRRRGVKTAIYLSDYIHVYQLLVKLLPAADLLRLADFPGKFMQVFKGQLAFLIKSAVTLVK